MAVTDNSDMEKKAQAFLDTGNHPGAETLFRQLCTLGADNYQAHSGLGKSLLGQNNFGEACTALERALRLQPDSVDVLKCLVGCYMQLGKPDGALDAIRRIIAIEPENVFARINFAKICYLSGRFDEAIDSLILALDRDPSTQEGHFYLCNSLIRSERLVEAANCLERAQEIWPDNAELASALAMTYYRLGQIEEAHETCRNIIRKHPRHAQVHSAFIYGLCYLPYYDAEYKFREHVHWGEIHAPAAAMRIVHNNDRSTDRPLKVGYLSPDLRMHSVAFFLQPLLSHHDRNSVQTYCYSNNDRADGMTAELRRLAGHWREIHQFDDARVTELVQADGIDILVDLAGHTAGCRPGVFARKPAPLQVAYLGYPATSGMAAMDYRITDEMADPAGMTDHLYTERLLRIPHGFLCYQPQTDAEVSSAPCIEKGYPTFGSFNNLAKVNAELVEVWCSVLQHSPGSRLLLKSKGLQFMEIRERTWRLFEERGVDRDRIELSGWAESLDKHLELYKMVDIALDTFPYNGTTTTCEALWMGVPVVTLAGAEHVGRVGVSLLSQAGLVEFITADSDAYIALAVSLAVDKQRLASMRARLRGTVRESLLCDAAGTTRDIEDAYRKAWVNWVTAQR